VLNTFVLCVNCLLLFVVGMYLTSNPPSLLLAQVLNVAIPVLVVIVLVTRFIETVIELKAAFKGRKEVRNGSR